ncbi:MAG: amino acid ABC transporter substrate-binding protein [Desulfobacterales bacterium]|nr:amino acid ABC transporter substrate-binding protein [Desulfobacterales bacterium]MBF0396682.1 amino acid ABC transporter substrate-binding protein [Desulfobacterales bacterium]
MKKSTLYFLTFFAVLFIYANVLAAEKKIIVVAEEWPPFEFLDQDKKPTGIDVDIASEILKKLNIDFEVKILPWARAWEMLQKGEADASFSTSKKAEREEFLYYPNESMWVSEVVFFVKKDKKLPEFKGYEDAKKNNLKIGVIRGNSYNDAFWQAFPYADTEKKKINAQLDEAVDMETNIKKLAAGRIDLYIVDKTVGLYGVKKLNLQNEITYYETVLYSKNYPMPFAKKSSYPNIKEVGEKFEKELIELKKSGKYDEIRKKWLQ